MNTFPGSIGYQKPRMSCGRKCCLILSINKITWKAFKIYELLVPTFRVSNLGGLVQDPSSKFIFKSQQEILIGSSK